MLVSKLLQKICAITFFCFISSLFGSDDPTEINNVQITKAVSSSEIFPFNDLPVELQFKIVSSVGSQSLFPIITTSSLFLTAFIEKLNEELTTLKKEAIENGSGFYAFTLTPHENAIAISNEYCNSDIFTKVESLSQFNGMGLSNNEIIKLLKNKFFKNLNHFKEYINNPWDLSYHNALASIEDKKAIKKIYLKTYFMQSSLPTNLWEFNHLDGLTILNLRSRYDYWIPPQFGLFEQLKKLELSYLGLKSVPDTVKELKNLKILNLNGNNLKKLPYWIGEFQNLKELILDHNDNLEELPNEVGDLGNLTKLSITACSGLQASPHSLKNLKKLKEFYFYFTRFARNNNIGNCNTRTQVEAFFNDFFSTELAPSM